MSNQVVTIGYLREFVDGKLTVSTDMPNTYCPTYGELTGGALVPNYSSASNPKDTVNGIDIPNCTVDIGYTSDQLVIRQDLLLKYMVLDSISIKADSTDIDKCGGSTNICVTGTFHLVTKSEDGETDGNAETDTTIPVTWSGDADNSGPSTCTVISFGLNAVSGIGTANPISAPARTESTTATYTYKGTNLTSDNDTTKTSNTVTITQGANNVGDWYHVSSEDVADRLVASCPTSIVSENGGTASMSTTLEYRQRWKANDSCGNIVGLKYVSATKSGPGDSYKFEEQECDADARTHTLSASLCGLTASCTAEQEASSVPCFCGGGCADVGCSGESHWGCAMKKGETEYEYYCDTAEVNGLDENKYLPSDGGTATVTIKGKSKKGIWTRSASCGYETLPTQIVTSLPSLPNSESSQNTIYLLVDKEGKTGGTLYYYDSNGNRQSTYSYTYTSYTQYHYTVWLEDVTIGKKTIKEERWGWKNIGTSYKKDANSATSYTERGYTYTCGNGYYANCDDKRDEYITDGNSASSWDSAYEVWYEKYQKYMDSERFFCDGVEVANEEEMLNCTGEQDRRLDESLNPGYFSIYGYYMSSDTVYGDGDDVDMNSVYACCVRNISTEYNKLVEHLSDLKDIEATLSFNYDANDTDTPKPGTATVTLPNGKTCSVSYIVGNGKSKFELSTTDTTVEAAAAEASVTVTSKKDDKPYPTFTFSESCDWVSDLTINNPESTNGSYSVQATLVPNTSAERKCEVTVSQTGGKTDKFTITQKGKQGCMTISYTLTQGAACTVYFKTTNGTQEGSHYVDATGNQQLCNIAPGTELVVSCSDTAVTIGGDIQFTYTHDSTASISLTKTGGGGGDSRVCMDVVVTNDDNCSGDLLFKNASGVKIDECSIDNGAAVTFCYNKGETVYISMRDNDGTSCQLQNGGTSFTVIEGGTIYVNISCNGGGGEETSCYGLYVVCDRTQNRFKYDFTPLTQTDLTLKVTFYNSGAEIGTYTNTLIPQGMSGSDWLTLNFDVSNCDDFSVTQLTENSRGDDYNMLCDGQSTCVFDDSEVDCTCSVTSINVTPSEYTFTSSGSAYFDVLLIDNGCSKCTSGWSIYKGSTFVKSGTSSTFSMSSDSDGEYTIKSNDNTNKVGKFTLTKYSPAPTTYSCKINYVNNTSETSKSAIVNLITTGLTAGQTKTLTLIGSNGSVDVTDTKAITWCINSITNNDGSKSFSHTTNNGDSCFSLTINGNEITITISDSTPAPTPCSCSVTSIRVSPSAHTFTSSGSAYFTVTIVDNDCSGCTNQFLVYNSNGTHVTSGISTFSLSNQSGTFTIKAKDNQNKTCTLTTTKYTAPDPVYVMQKTSADISTSITFPGDVSYDGVNSYGYICCYSTKDGSTQSVTASSDKTWLTVESNNSLPYAGASHNYKFTCSENTSTSSRSGTITLTQSGSNKTVTWTITQAGKPNSYTFTDVTPASNSTVSSSAVGSSIHVTSTKNGTNFSSITSSESCSWLTLGSPSLSGTYYYIPFDVTENTSTSSRSCDVKLTQGESGKEVTVTITQEGKPATCDCSTVSISCNPANSYTTGNSVSTTVTITGGTNCVTTWKAYSDSTGELLGSGENGKKLSRTSTGSVTFRADACTGKTATWIISKPECAKPTIRLSGSGDAYMLQSYSETDEWCGTNPNVSVSVSADYIGDGGDDTHYSPTTCSFEIANCAASITSFNLDSGGWILDSYTGLNSFGIGFTIRPDAIVNATCVLSGTFTYLMQGVPFSGTFSISIQFNG